MKRFLAIVTLSAILPACAGPSPEYVGTAAAHAPAMPVTQTEKVQGDTDNAHAEPPADAHLPSIELSEELLFKYLAAEISEQRGQWEAAYINMLAVAQQTRDPRLARRAAEIALNAKQADAALAAVRLWHETEPHAEEAAQYLISLLIINDQMEEARPLLKQRLQEAAPSARGALILHTQRLLARSNDKTAAFLMLEDLLSPYKALPETYLALAQAAHASGNSMRAALEARAALQANPRSELAALILAQVSADKNEALHALTSFLENNPQAREVRLAYARMLVEQKQYRQAAEQFKHLLKDQPRDLTALYAVGMLGMQTRNYDEAEHYLTAFLNALESGSAEERDPTQALLMLAQIAEERNDIPAALMWLGQIDPGNEEALPDVQIKRAQLMAKSGDVAGSLKLLKGIKAEDENREIQLIATQAQILKNGKQGQRALNLLKKALKKFPNNTDLLYDYALIAESLKKFGTMEQALRRIIRLAPDNQHAYNALGYSLADRKTRLKEARVLIRKALELSPEDPFIMDSMGWVEFRLGRLEEAERLLRRAYELRQDPEIATHLGEVLWARGQREDAKKLWRDANRKDPQNDTLKNTLGRLQVDL